MIADKTNMDIEKACKLLDKIIIDDNLEIYSEYSQMHFWTNENINAYLNLVSFKNKDNALSVLSSGDHVFNLITKGILNIDTFDSNRLTEYYALGLKRAMIIKYNYHDFKMIMDKIYYGNISNEELYELIKGLYSYMEYNHKLFWESMISYDFNLRKNNNLEENIIMLFFMKNPFETTLGNTYMLNEENYNILKNRLVNANISFKCANANNLASEFAKKKYGFIFLSNILDYFYTIYGYNWNYSVLKKYENSLEELCNENSIVFLHYAFGYLNALSEPIAMASDSLINFSDFKIKELKKEEIHGIECLNGSLFKDAVVLKRSSKNVYRL